ncbi:MAG: hypothetical protein MZV70_08630 [Desulfobacterales bacterium]|nr:hypothetical protein [Desulfobacterales bacterium]
MAATVQEVFWLSTPDLKTLLYASPGFRARLGAAPGCGAAAPGGHRRCRPPRGFLARLQRDPLGSGNPAGHRLPDRAPGRLHPLDPQPGARGSTTTGAGWRCWRERPPTSPSTSSFRKR